MLYYIGYYNCDTIRDEVRIVAPAAENKMNYMISALSDAVACDFEVVSPAETRLCRVIKGKKQQLHDRVTLKTFSSFSSQNKLVRALGHLLTRISFWLYLLTRVRSSDHLLVYHSLAYMKGFCFLRKFKRCKLTIEVEELYSDVVNDEQLRKKEVMCLQSADSYIFITELLKKEVNTQKLSVISHGTYRSNPDYGFRFDDDKIHVVYAGTFRRTKGGAYTAIASAEYLDERYVLEVLGSGSDAEISAIQNEINEVSKRTKCRINYAGFKTGDALNTYIQACHIGLSTQQADAKFNATSFPSKILMYMSNGIKVVTVRIPAIETSKIGPYVYYYDVQDAKEIANMIRTVSFDGDNSRVVLGSLHREFVDDLRLLLRE